MRLFYILSELQSAPKWCEHCARTERQTSPTTKILIEIDESYSAYHIMVHRLPIEVANQIKLRLDYNETITDIAKALKVSRNSVYKLQLNFNLWG